MKQLLLLFCLLSGFVKSSNSQGNYFPPLASSAAWDTISPSSLGWCSDKIDTLYNYLEQENTKGFLVLKDGKIVLEKYFGTFVQDSVWYWASAGKTVTSFLTGQAQELGYLNINDKSSGYLGNGWTNCASPQEDSITILNQLTMTSGLDDGVPDNHCTIDTCLNYLAPVNTRWSYHNAAYTLLEQVLENATSMPINAFTQQKMKTPTGMTGLWVQTGFDNVYFSTARSMARFGILIQNNGIWNNDTLLHDTAYKTAMINSSQMLNKSYGYLWWLNGKASYMVPTSQFVIPGSYAPDAPSDMYAAIGKNGQILSIAPGKGLVVIRMGDNPSSNAEVPFLLCTEIWKRLNEAMCSPASLNEDLRDDDNFVAYPNPAQTILSLRNGSAKPFTASITSIDGKQLFIDSAMKSFDISSWPVGMYMIKIQSENTIIIKKFSKQ